MICELKLKKCKREYFSKWFKYSKGSNMDILLNGKYDKIYTKNYEVGNIFINIIILGQPCGVWAISNFIIKEILC